MGLSPLCNGSVTRTSMAKAGTSRSCCSLGPRPCSPSPPAVDTGTPFRGCVMLQCGALFTGSSGLCTVGTRPSAVCWVLGVGVGVEIKVCFLPFHVAWSFGLDGLNTPSPECSNLALLGTASDRGEPQIWPRQGEVSQQHPPQKLLCSGGLL